MKNSDEDIINNLKDAGCDSEMINKFMNKYHDKSIDDFIRMLQWQRCKLLEKIHDDQRQIDCLDYLIFSLTKNENNK